jgi:hypothetical protein
MTGGSAAIATGLNLTSRIGQAHKTVNLDATRRAGVPAISARLDSCQPSASPKLHSCHPSRAPSLTGMPAANGHRRSRSIATMPPSGPLAPPAGSILRWSPARSAACPPQRRPPRTTSAPASRPGASSGMPAMIPPPVARRLLHIALPDCSDYGWGFGRSHHFPPPWLPPPMRPRALAL